MTAEEHARIWAEEAEYCRKTMPKEPNDIAYTARMGALMTAESMVKRYAAIAEQDK